MVSLSKRVVLEGEYSTWTQKWTSDASVYNQIISYGAIDVNGKRIYVRGENRWAILNLDDGTLIEDASIFLQPSSSTMVLDKSLKGKYEVKIHDATNIRIYKAGSLQQTITVAGADFTYGAFMNSDGKYIVAFDNTNNRFYCFEGS